MSDPRPTLPQAVEAAPETSRETTARQAAFETAPLPNEFYMEGPYMVFTAEYHLRRGYCCNSDCRHCPFR
jgi:hypothetical protein